MELRIIKCAFLFCLLIIIPVYLIAVTRIINFHARFENNSVILEWTTEQETNTEKFVIERSANKVHWNNPYENKDNEIAAAGNSNTRKVYTFTDNRIYKGQTSTLYYRLSIVYLDGTTAYHEHIAETGGISTIRHTWGSIKAMFR